MTGAKRAFAIRSKDGTVLHRVAVGDQGDVRRIADFASREGQHGWRVLEEDRYLREAAVDQAIGVPGPACEFAHADVDALMTTIEGQGGKP